MQILILLTAGKQTKDQSSFKPLREASQPLRDKGIKIYVVGVRSDEDVDEDELIQISGSQGNVLTTDTFEELVVLAEDISKVICGKLIFIKRKLTFRSSLVFIDYGHKYFGL